MQSVPAFHVLGAGSIGLLFAASIRHRFPSYPITLLLRESSIQKVKSYYSNNPSKQQIPTTSTSTTTTAPTTTMMMMMIEVERTKTVVQKQKLRMNYSPEVWVPIQSTTGTTGNVTSTRSNDNETCTGTQQQHSQPPLDNNIQNLIVATKSYQAVDAIRSVMARLRSKNDVDNNNNNSVGSSSSSRIILLCNGALSVRDELLGLWGKEEEEETNIVLATTTHGAYREHEQQQHQQHHQQHLQKINTEGLSNHTYSFYWERRRICHAGFGNTFIENNDHRCGYIINNNNKTERICKLWNESGLNCTLLSKSQMNVMLWNKLAANCVINPLTSIYRCTNGELLMEPTFFDLQERILNEVADVAAGVLSGKKYKEKQGTEKNAAATTMRSTGSDYNDDSFSSTVLLESMRTFVTQAIKDTRDNKSSMYQDIITGQRTEIEDLNGYVVRKGKTIGKCCPTNEELCRRITKLQAVISL